MQTARAKVKAWTVKGVGACTVSWGNLENRSENTFQMLGCGSEEDWNAGGRLHNNYSYWNRGLSTYMRDGERSQRNLGGKLTVHVLQLPGIPAKKTKCIPWKSVLCIEAALIYAESGKNNKQDCQGLLTWTKHIFVGSPQRKFWADRQSRLGLHMSGLTAQQFLVNQ